MSWLIEVAFAYDIVLRLWAYSLGLTLALGVFVAGWEMMRFYERVKQDPEAAGMLARMIAILFAILLRRPLIGRNGLFTSRASRHGATVIRENKYQVVIKAAFQVTLALLVISSLIIKWMSKP